MWLCLIETFLKEGIFAIKQYSLYVLVQQMHPYKIVLPRQFVRQREYFLVQENKSYMTCSDSTMRTGH